VIKGKDHKEYYLPYIEEIVKKVDVNEKVVWIEPMEGLFD
jgi:16S rRNA processing protein RimM